MSNVGQSIQSLVKDYDDKALTKEIALRAASMSKSASIAGELNPAVSEDAEHLGTTEDLLELGTRIFRRVEREIHGMVCGGAAEDKGDRESILKATGSDVALGTALYAALTASLGLAPAVATVVAALLIKRIFAPAGEEICKFWAERIAKQA